MKKKHWLTDSALTDETCIGCSGKGCSMCRYTGTAKYLDGPMFIKQAFFFAACCLVFGLVLLFLLPEG